MEIEVSDFKAHLEKNPNCQIIDVREPHEYEETNMGGKLIPLASLLDRLSELDQYKDDFIVVHCRSGKRSIAACDVMRTMGFSKVYSLKGGILAWNEFQNQLINKL
jgi:rhodanese-related sulfurtransferase